MVHSLFFFFFLFPILIIIIYLPIYLFVTTQVKHDNFCNCSVCLLLTSLVLSSFLPYVYAFFTYFTFVTNQSVCDWLILLLLVNPILSKCPQPLPSQPQKTMTIVTVEPPISTLPKKSSPKRSLTEGVHLQEFRW